MTLDVEHLPGREIDRIYLEWQRQGKITLSGRERRYFRRMRQRLFLYLASYVFMLVLYLLVWVARWFNLL